MDTVFEEITMISIVVNLKVIESESVFMFTTKSNKIVVKNVFLHKIIVCPFYIIRHVKKGFF